MFSVLRKEIVKRSINCESTPEQLSYCPISLLWHKGKPVHGIQFLKNLINTETQLLSDSTPSVASNKREQNPLPNSKNVNKKQGIDKKNIMSQYFLKQKNDFGFKICKDERLVGPFV